jgi:hypothetical protein
MPGKKTHEQQIRTFERKPDLPDRRQVDTALARDTQGSDGIYPRARKAVITINPLKPTGP